MKMLSKSVIQLIIILTFIVTLDFCTATDYTIRSTKYGSVKGIVERMHGHHRIEKFFGIPYASAPIGKLRLEVRPFLPGVQNRDFCMYKRWTIFFLLPCMFMSH